MLGQGGGPVKHGTVLMAKKVLKGEELESWGCGGGELCGGPGSLLKR